MLPRVPRLESEKRGSLPARKRGAVKQENDLLVPHACFSTPLHTSEAAFLRENDGEGGGKGQEWGIIRYRMSVSGRRCRGVQK
jgi:hypothetical protein